MVQILSVLPFTYASYEIIIAARSKSRLLPCLLLNKKTYNKEKLRK